MIEPAFGPYLFDTSAEYWLATSNDLTVRRWLAAHVQRHSLYVSAITVMERMRGYALSIQRDPPDRQTLLALKRQEYLDSLGEVLPVDGAVALPAADWPLCFHSRPHHQSALTGSLNRAKTDCSAGGVTF